MIPRMRVSSLFEINGWAVCAGMDCDVSESRLLLLGYRFLCACGIVRVLGVIGLYPFRIRRSFLERDSGYLVLSCTVKFDCGEHGGLGRFAVRSRNCWQDHNSLDQRYRLGCVSSQRKAKGGGWLRGVRVRQ